MLEIDKLKKRTERHGALPHGRVMATGVLALSLSLANSVLNRMRWRPSFAFARVVPAALRGEHKADAGPQFPEHCGVLGGCAPGGFWRQLRLPFAWKG